MQNFHYIAISAFVTTKNNSIMRCCEQQESNEPSEAGYVKIYKVPLPINAPYIINDMKPYVFGVELIAKIKYKEKQT